MASSFLVPNIEIPDIGAAMSPALYNFNYLPGFNGDGDYFKFPLSPIATADLTYYNASGSLVWTYEPTDIDAACERWTGFHYDKTDNLLYVIVADYAVSPGTYYLASIDAAGTITNIGNDTPSVDFDSGALTGWMTSDPDAPTNSAMVQRAADGSGNLFIRATTNSAGLEEAEINISTGAFVSDPTSIKHGVASSWVGTFYKTDDDIYVGAYSPQAVSNMGVFYLLICYGSLQTSIPIAPGLVPFAIEADGLHPFQHGDYVAFVGNMQSRMSYGGWAIYDKTTFEAWVKELLTRLKFYP